MNMLAQSVYMARSNMARRNGRLLSILVANPMGRERCLGLRMKSSASVLNDSHLTTPLSSQAAPLKTVLIDQLEPSKQRPKTSMERMKEFPKNVWDLWLDCLLYKNIRDASRTRLNAWTVNHPFLVSSAHAKLPARALHLYEDELRPGRIPRRQHEQQRRVRVAVGTMLPIVIIWIPPIIGYLPMILAVAAPRQVLSRHFHNEYEIYQYNVLEYDQRRKEFDVLADMFWNLTVVGHKADHLDITSKGHDVAGPLIDALPFYSVFAHKTGLSEGHHLRNGMLSPVASFPREYLVKFALAIGVNQYLPSWASPMVTSLSPTLWLRFQVQRAAKVVCEDDTLLLLERHDENQCNSLTDLEVMDACLMRGLPITNVSVDEMRQALTNHLKMVASVRERLDHGPMTEGFGLFTLTLPILRHALRRKHQQ